MKPTITYRKGMFEFNTGMSSDMTAYNLLSSSPFVSQNPQQRHKFYCMYNNSGVYFIKSNWKLLKAYFDIDDSVRDRMDPVDYTGKRDLPLRINPLPGITYRPHQNHALEAMSQHRNYCLFLGAGTGKTLIAIGFIKSYYEQPGPGLTYVGRVLVVTPKKVIGQYMQEAEKYLWGWHIHNKDKYTKDSAYELIVTNYERLKKFEKVDVDIVIYDESHRLKNPQSNMSKSAMKIKSENTYLFTGTPTDQAKHELFAQFQILNPIFRTPKYTFMERYFRVDDYGKPIDEKRPAEMDEVINKMTYGADTEELLTDLPPEEEHVIKCVFDDFTQTLYKTFAKDKIIAIEGQTIVGDTTGGHRAKLRQICNGFVYYEDEVTWERKAIRLSNPKTMALRSLIYELGHGIVFTQYDEDIEIIKEVMLEEKQTFIWINGKTKNADPHIQDFKDGKYDWLVIQMTSGNAGLDLIVTNNMIFYTLPDSFITFKQAKYRIRRIGQTKPCRYFYLTVRGTVETEVLRALQNKKSFNNAMFKLYAKGEK